MSRVANAHILLPANVELTLAKGKMTIKGPKGTLTQPCNKLVKVSTSEDNDKQVEFKPASNDPNAWAQAGTARAIMNNMIKGVTTGFEKTLELVGVGYRAQGKGNVVSLALGFSHSIEYDLPEGISAETPNVTTIILKGIDKQLVGQVAAEIRSFRPPEPYKGKGVKYAGEAIVRKQAKKK